MYISSNINKEQMLEEEIEENEDLRGIFCRFDSQEATQIIDII